MSKSRFDRYFEHAEGEKKPAVFSQQKKRQEICGLPEGCWVEDGIYRMDRFYELGVAYGARVLDRPENMSIMRHFGATSHIVFLDLETTGLAGGTGTYAFLCGIGMCSGDSFRVTQFFLEGPAREAAFLRTIDSLIPEGSCLVTYNGGAFDLPLLRTRHILARSEPVWKDMPHIDLLYHARRLYRGRYDSCSLGSMERNVLGVARSGVDIPGYLIPGIYMEYLRSRNAFPLAGVFYHNELDIASLAALYCHIGRVLDGETADGFELLKAGDFWHKKGFAERSAKLWDRARCEPCSRVSVLLRHAFRAKKAGDHNAARENFLAVLAELRKKTFPSTTEETSFCSLLEELAKLEEHRFGDYAKAIEYVDEALAWLKANRYLLGRAFGIANRSLLHRRERLQRKWTKQTGVKTVDEKEGALKGPAFLL